MGYRNKYGRTVLKKERFNNLQLGWEYDRDPKKNFPSLLFTPDMNNSNVHYHIDLRSKKQVQKLHKWLTEYLKDKK